MKPARIEDLSPFFEDRCWMFVLLARQANVGVILRRGPTKWFHVTLWDTQKDAFEGGQWFHGQIYPERCDVSADGKLVLYFAGKFRQRDVARTWIAISRPPYLTALALWPIGHTWGQGGVFVDDRTVLIGTSKHHPDHPPGPLRVLDCALKEGDPRLDLVPCWRSGWQAWRKTCGDLILNGGALGGTAHFIRCTGQMENLSLRSRRTGPTGTSGADWLRRLAAVFSQESSRKTISSCGTS